MAENSPRGTLLTDFGGTQFIRLQIIDNDVVSAVLPVGLGSRSWFAVGCPPRLYG